MPGLMKVKQGPHGLDERCVASSLCLAEAMDLLVMVKSLDRPFVPLLRGQIPGKVVSHALITSAFELEDQGALPGSQLCGQGRACEVLFQPSFALLCTGKKADSAILKALRQLIPLPQLSVPRILWFQQAQTPRRRDTHK